MWVAWLLPWSWALGATTEIGFFFFFFFFLVGSGGFFLGGVWRFCLWVPVGLRRWPLDSQIEIFSWCLLLFHNACFRVQTPGVQLTSRGFLFPFVFLPGAVVHTSISISKLKVVHSYGVREFFQGFPRWIVVS